MIAPPPVLVLVLVPVAAVAVPLDVFVSPVELPVFVAAGPEEVEDTPEVVVVVLAAAGPGVDIAAAPVTTTGIYG